jgi:peptide/nickel transport system substrate-binding protein
MHPLTRREFLRLCGFSFAGMFAASCAPLARTPISGPTKRAGVPVLRLAGGDNGYPSPFAYVRGPGYIRSSYIFDTLIWKDSQGYIPWLATDWQLSSDGKTWRFTLRDGVKWQDGSALTADDVVFTFEYTKKLPANLPHTRGIELINHVIKTDDRHIEIELSKPYAPFLANIAGAVPVIPKHIWGKIANPFEYVAPEAVIGSGPYKLVTYEKTAGAYRYEAYDDFWLGKPFVQRIELVPVADELAALRQGGIDGAGFPYEGGITDEMLAPFQQPTFGIVTAPGDWNAAIHFNLTQGAPYNQVKFRQALAWAIDREELVKQILMGRGDPGTPGWLAPSNPWRNPNVEPYKFNLAKARALLDDLGYADANGDGIRDLPNGKPLEIPLLYDSASFARVPAMLQKMLREAGIAVVLKPVTRAVLDESTASENFQVAITYYGGLGGDPDILRQVFCAKSQARIFYRVQGYLNPRFDELAELQLTTTDDVKRKALVFDLQTILAHEVPVLPLYYPTRYWIYSKNVLASWYYTPGGIAMGPPFTLNKHAFVTGETIGLQIRGR